MYFHVRIEMCTFRSKLKPPYRYVYNLKQCPRSQLNTRSIPLVNHHGHLQMTVDYVILSCA